MFKEYKSKPIIRKAHEITEQDKLTWDMYDHCAYIQYEGKSLCFTCHGEPKVGDYIVYLNDEDVYHCNREVFHERNEV